MKDIESIFEKIKVSPYSVGSVISFCGCNMPISNNEFRKDCYFYYEEPDMGAHIPTCNYYEKLGYCPCDGCKKFYKKSDVFSLIKKAVDEE